MARLPRLPAATRLTGARSGVPGPRTRAGLRSTLRRLNGVDVSQLHAKAAAAVWAVLLCLITPERIWLSLGSVLVVIMTGLVFTGSIVSAAGLLRAARISESDPDLLRQDLRRSLHGLGIELVGLALMLIGISLYFLTQLVLSFGVGGDQRIALTAFAYFSGAMVLGRVAAVQHRRRKETRLATALGGTT